MWKPSTEENLSQPITYEGSVRCLLVHATLLTLAVGSLTPQRKDCYYFSLLSSYLFNICTNELQMHIPGDLVV